MEQLLATQRIQFFDLPLDIRRIVYEEYLDDQCHPPAKVIHEEPLSALKSCWQPAILTVNKQMNDEVMHLSRIRTTFTSQITWQEFEFDRFTECCIRAREEKMGYGDMRHLRIEIYSPHPDRPMDMVHILENVDQLYYDLNYVERLQDLSIIFLENEVASWSRNGKAKESMNLQWYGDDEDGFSDIGYIFDHLNMLTNIAKVSIHLPDSLASDEEIHAEREDVEKRMMASFDDDLARTAEIRNETRHLMAEATPRLKETTGKMSRAAIEAACDYGLRKVSIKDLQYLKSIWPYTEVLADREYFPDHKYTGVAPSESLVSPPVRPCTCLRTAPRIESERKRALKRAITNPDWDLCPKLRHEVLGILLLMRNCPP